MRIIAGKFGSRRLAAPGDLKLRPTSDQLRETLFNVLGPSIEGSVFVDVFAGTGAVGIEALSRGASRVIFIEKHHATAELIRKTLQAFEAEGEICEGGALRELKQLVSRGLIANYVFADPPYPDADSLRAVLDFVAQREMLAPDGIVIAEHAARTKMPDAAGTLRRTRELKQGDSALSFYRR